MFDEKWANLLTPATWSGALIGGVGGLTFNEWMILGGFILAVLGFVVNTIHKYAMYRLAKNNVQSK